MLSQTWLDFFTGVHDDEAQREENWFIWAESKDTAQNDDIKQDKDSR